MSAGQDWVEQARRLVETFRAGADGGAPPAGAGGADCRWCPLCQAAAVLRGERPEVSAALADVLTATAAALRSFAGEPAPGAAEPGAAEPDPAAAGQDGPERERPAPAVQRIELS